MNTKLFLLLGTSLSLIPTLTFSQCVATQDCATLGYTETSCSGGKGIKCPFGNKWACLPTKETICKEEGFTLACNETGQIGSGDSCNGLYKKCACNSTYKYTCSGTGYAGGSGAACGGKYTACKCASGYEWKNGACTETIPTVSCTVGTLYYSDGKCHNQKVASKTLLGVVIMKKTTSQMGWIMTINPIQTGIMWGGYGTDIPGLSNCTSTSCLTDIQASCSNTDAITTYGNSSKYPAAWAAKNYKPSGTPSGKSWCLPSGGLLKNSLNNQTNLDRINAGITTAGGKKIGFGTSYSYERVWSSSEYGNGSAWYFYADTSGSFSMYYDTKGYGSDYGSVRPVLAF